MLKFSTTEQNYLNPKLQDLEDKNLLLIAFPVTNTNSISEFKKLWSKYDMPNKAVGRPNESTQKIESDIVGGCITLIDPNIDSNAEAEVLAQINIKTPRGLFFCPAKRELLVGSAFDVKRIKNGRIIDVVQHNLFSGVHSIKPSKSGYYIVSSSTDSIVEISSDYSKILWDWLGTENGYQLTKDGDIRFVDRQTDYSKLGDISTSQHTTHINGVEEYDDEHVLATLFHQDQLIKINKRTNRQEVVFSKLTNPHAIHKYKDKFIISDTRGNRVLILNRDFSINKIIPGDFDWVQDTIPFEDKLLVLNANKGRIEILDGTFELEKQIYWSTDFQMSNCLYKISAEDAKEVFI